MTVAELINQIARVSFNDDNPSATDRERILSYLNLANDQIYVKVSQIGSAFLSKTENLSLTSSSVALPADHYKTIRVVDTTNSRVLQAKEVEVIEDEIDPTLSTTGRPEYFYITNNTLNVFPLQDVNLRFRYTPTVPTLVDEASDATILYPKPFHQVLIDGGLYYMFEDERDRRAIQEISIAGGRFTKGLASLVEYYKNEAREPQTVEYIDY